MSGLWDTFWHLLTWSCENLLLELLRRLRERTACLALDCWSQLQRLLRASCWILREFASQLLNHCSWRQPRWAYWFHTSLPTLLISLPCSPSWLWNLSTHHGPAGPSIPSLLLLPSLSLFPAAHWEALMMHQESWDRKTCSPRTISTMRSSQLTSTEPLLCFQAPHGTLSVNTSYVEKNLFFMRGTEAPARADRGESGLLCDLPKCWEPRRPPARWKQVEFLKMPYKTDSFCS